MNQVYFWGEPASGVAVTHFVPFNAPLEVVTVRWNGSLLFAFGANSAWTLPALVPGLLLRPRNFFFDFQMCPSEDVRLSYPFLDKIIYLLPTPFKPSIGWRIQHWLSLLKHSFRREEEKRKKNRLFFGLLREWPRYSCMCVCVSRGHIPLYIAQGAADELALRDQGFLVCVCCVEFHRGLDTVKEREREKEPLARLNWVTYIYFLRLWPTSLTQITFPFLVGGARTWLLDVFSCRSMRNSVCIGRAQHQSFLFTVYVYMDRCNHLSQLIALFVWYINSYFCGNVEFGDK